MNALSSARRGVAGHPVLAFSAVIVLFGTAVIIATKGQLGRRAAAPASKEGDAAGDHVPDDAGEGGNPAEQP